MQTLARQTVLFITPTTPAPSGHGTAMRARAVLEALSRRFRVSLIVVPLYRARRFNRDVSGLEPLCACIHVLSPGKNTQLPCLSDRFDVIYVLRLAVVGWAQQHLLSDTNAASFRVLDLDDYDSERSFRFAKLADLQRDSRKAQQHRRQAEYYRSIESFVLPRFHRIIVSSAIDQARLTARFSGLAVVTYPNGIDIPPHNYKALNSELTLLFVGTMDYFPNEDAVVYFSEEILPLLRRGRFGKDIRVMIVGCRPTERVLRLRKNPEVSVIGEVECLDSYYSAADIVIVPLRAGSGTRIKILEAFAYRRAVVSTSVGCEGLDVQHGIHLSIADTPADFAYACEELIANVRYRENVVLRAFEWLRRNQAARDSCCLIPEMPPVVIA
jgi:glycosyltransferase involved in cell wall biosynthesis